MISLRCTPVNQVSGKHVGTGAFTLIELVLVLVIVSTVLTLVAPRLGGTLGFVTLRSCAREVAMTLNFAHYGAVHNGARYRVNYDFDNDAYWVSVKPDSSPYVQVAEHWGTRRLLPPGIYFRDVTTVRNTRKTTGKEYTAFSPAGQGEQCVLHLAGKKDEVYTIVVSKSLGKATVLDYEWKP